MRFLIINVLFLISSLVVAQTITVVNKVNDKPISDAFVFCKSQFGITNKNGQLNINNFPKNEIIIIKHASFITSKITYYEIEKKNFIIPLYENVLNINEVVISANKWEQNKKEVPNKISVMHRKDIEFNNPQTTADLLGTSNEVFIQKSQMGGGSPMIRGFSANRILIVVDGVRMNNAIFRSGNLQNVISLDANSIQETEVIFGPGSVIYGSDAIGGVMDFHTLTPKLSLNDRVNFKANALARYSSANKEKTGHIDLNLGYSTLSFLTSFTYSDFDDLRMGSKNHSDYIRKEYIKHINGEDKVINNKDENIQKPTGYSQCNFMQKIRFRPNDKFDLNYGFHYSQLSDVPRYDRLIEYKGNELKYSRWYYGPQKWMMNILNLKYKGNNLFFDDIKMAAALQNYQESRHNRKFKGKTKDKLFERTENVDALSLNIDFDKTLNDNSSLYYGVEAVSNNVYSKSIKKDIYSGEKSSNDTRYPDGSTYATFAGYTNYKNNINEYFTFLSGFRYSYVFLHADFDKAFYDFPFDKIDIGTGELNGSVGLVYRPNVSWQINTNISTGFRAPNIDDASKVFKSGKKVVIVPNENLKSEYAYNFELGILKSLNNIIKVDVTGFYTLLKDAMVRRDFSFNGKKKITYEGDPCDVQALVNAEEAKIWGAQFTVVANITNSLSLKSSLNYTKGETSDKKPIRHVAPLFGSTHLLYKIKNFKVDLYANYNGQISYSDLADSQRDNPHLYDKDKNGNPYCSAWHTFNLKLNYNITNNIIFNFGVENIMDVRYRPYSSGIVAPGQNFIFGLRVKI